MVAVVTEVKGLTKTEFKAVIPEFETSMAEFYGVERVLVTSVEEKVVNGVLGGRRLGASTDLEIDFVIETTSGEEAAAAVEKSNDAGSGAAIAAAVETAALVVLKKTVIVEVVIDTATQEFVSDEELLLVEEEAEQAAYIPPEDGDDTLLIAVVAVVAFSVILVFGALKRKRALDKAAATVYATDQAAEMARKTALKIEADAAEMVLKANVAAEEKAIRDAENKREQDAKKTTNRATVAAAYHAIEEREEMKKLILLREKEEAEEEVKRAADEAKHAEDEVKHAEDEVKHAEDEAREEEERMVKELVAQAEKAEAATAALTAKRIAAAKLKEERLAHQLEEKKIADLRAWLARKEQEVDDEDKELDDEVNTLNAIMHEKSPVKNHNLKTALPPISLYRKKHPEGVGADVKNNWESGSNKSPIKAPPTGQKLKKLKSPSPTKYPPPK